MVAAFAIGSTHGSGEGKGVTVIVAGEPGSDKASTFSCTFHHDTSIRHACHNTVSAHEVDLVGIGLGEMFRQESALADHLVGCFAMTRRIKVIESVGQYAHRLITLLKSIAVGTDVNAVSQSTDDENLRTPLLQPFDETAHEVLAIDRAMTGTHNVDNALLVEIGSTFIEKQ